ncbi:uncharacterized protein BKA55DRAFT_698632 [Fusarium redolens]|uniref:Uncharacterized protein n=1 Tax=Fusarium redolens TaxID=48865 RepID=A0A9P9FWS2_FUSRE|nr:uncharacterized protein BKA55DRAFT_698632 [Fusarium redolens]KAH7205164.1 hypothetical protein BKA55DRAFT_698632 [Fusarium redolens]
MLGLVIDVDLDHIEDDLTYPKVGWSFLQKAENKLADIWTMLIDKVILSSFRGKPYIKDTDWQVETCMAYLNAGVTRIKSAFAGLPGRGTKVTGIRYVNTELAIRNFFFRGGRMIIISYSKARVSNNCAFYIVHYLTPNFSLSLLKYLAIMQPTLSFIAQQLKIPYNLDNKCLFPDPCGKRKHLSSAQASEILKDLTQNLPTPWTLSSYRRASLAIAKH